jgi:hypothetical protein
MRFEKRSLMLFLLVSLGLFGLVLAAFPTDVSVYLNTTDNLNTSTSNYNFTYTILWNGSYFINNCTLWGNFTGIWAVNETNTTAVVNGTDNLHGINTSLSDGTYIWNVECYYNDTNTDTADANRTITIDTGEAGVTFVVPSASSWHNSDFLINVSVADSPVTVQYRYENSTTNGTWTSMTNPSGNYWNATFDISAVANGNYTIRINATDAAANSNTTETRLIWVDTQSPTITSFSCSPTSVYIGDETTCSCSATDNLDTSVGLSYTRNPVTHSADTYQTTCTATDDAGNSASSTTSYTVSYRPTGYGKAPVTTTTTTKMVPITTTISLITTTIPATTRVTTTPPTTIPTAPLAIPMVSWPILVILVVVFIVLAWRLKLFK